MTNFTEHQSSSEPQPNPSTPWQQLLNRHHWLPFVLPFAVFMVLGTLEPAAPSNPQTVAPASANGASDGAETAAPSTPGPSDTSARGLYPLIYSIRIAATALCVWLVWPVWRTFPRQLNWGWSIGVGTVGVALWVAVCRLHIERGLYSALGFESWAFGGRVAFDPYTALGDTPIFMALFLAIRMAGLALIVPLMEEFFLRGFLMRFFDKPDWWTIALGTVTWKSALVATVYGVVTHPGEAVAAALWFSLITVLYWRTRSIWNCVAAHAVTNGLLGVYVLVWQDWTLW